MRRVGSPFVAERGSPEKLGMTTELHVPWMAWPVILQTGGFPLP